MSSRGSVKKDSTGRWYFVVDLETTDGRRRQARRRGFPTKRRAQEALDELVALAAAGLYLQPTKVTIGQYFVEHWLPSLAATVRPTTADTYRRLAGAHIIPMLGAVPLQKLDRRQVSRWIGELSAKNLAPKTIRNIHGVLAKAVADAVDLELVNRNVAARPKGLPPARRAAPRAWTPEQLRTFLQGTAGDRLFPLWRLIAVTGCRRGEALGLQWGEVDLDAGVVTIMRQRAIAGGSVVEGTPKTNAGARTVAIDENTADVLRSWRRLQVAEHDFIGLGWVESQLVFTHPDGTGLWPQMVTARFREQAEALGLPLIGLHGLRHTAASAMIAAGVNPRVVQQRLGHAHVSVTLGLYTHVLPGHDEAAADLLAAAIDGGL